MTSHAYYEAHKEKILETSHAYYEAHREQVIEQTRKWKKANPEKACEHTLRWKKANPEKNVALSTAYNKRHPDKHRADYWRHPEERKAAHAQYNKDHPEIACLQSQRRRARQNGAISPGQWYWMLGYFGGYCAYCLQPMGKATTDHMIPISRGGRHEISNAVPCCQSCNSHKHSQTPLEYLAGRRFGHTESGHAEGGGMSPRGVRGGGHKAAALYVTSDARDVRIHAAWDSIAKARREAAILRR